MLKARVSAATGKVILDGLAKRPTGRTLWRSSQPAMVAASPEIAELKAEINRLSAQLQLLAAQTQPLERPSPWLPLDKAAPFLHCLPRTLRRRIVAGQYPDSCYRRLSDPSGKRSTYLFNVERYLESLR